MVAENKDIKNFTKLN